MKCKYFYREYFCVEPGQDLEDAQRVPAGAVHRGGGEAADAAPAGVPRLQVPPQEAPEVRRQRPGRRRHRHHRRRQRQRQGGGRGLGLGAGRRARPRKPRQEIPALAGSDVQGSTYI